MSPREDDLNDAGILRKKAEEKLKEKQRQTKRDVKETNVNKLVHELQVHQIELEMQNEELREANETAERALKKYTMLYDFAPMGYFTLEKDGSITDLNFSGAEMLGEKRFSLINSNFKLFVSEESHSEFDNFFQKIFASDFKESCELLLGYDDKPLCRVYIEGIVTGDEGRCLLSAVDISGFKR